MPDHARARGDRQMNVVRGVTEWLQRTKLVGLALDWAEALAGAVDIHGCDFVIPEPACSMLRAFAEHQRADGLIAEYIDGHTGQAEDHGFNINDNTPLFVMAVGHHARVTGHQDCLQAFYEPARRAGEAILRARDERGLVSCTADGIGITGICS